MDSAQAKIFADSLQHKTVGGWTIEGDFGNGKSAVVLPAVKDGVEAAIKIFYPELVERFGKDVQLERILREKSLIGAEHPNLVRILDGGECTATGQLYLYVVMERLPYKNLQKVINDIPKDRIIPLLSQVASAARFLEDRNLAHRDIKPENIVVSPDFSRAVLLDLGVLRPVGLSDLTDVNARFFIGTLRYSSPEYLLRQEEDSTEGWRALTFYQLGAVLHDMLMKRVLFEEFSEPFPILVEAVKTEIPKVISEDARAASLANHCLVKKPSTRLELVSWADFLEAGPQDNTNITTARERIKQKQKYYQANVPNASLPAADLRRLSKQALDDLCNRVESRVAALMNDLQCFPLRKTKSHKNVDEQLANTCIHFEKDNDTGLPHHLTLMFESRLIDLNNGSPIFATGVAATLSESEITSESLQPAKHCYTGEAQVLLDNHFEQYFLSALEEAYKYQDQGKHPKGNKVLRLLEEGN